jgi:undecaprenyl-diphosphatase
VFVALLVYSKTTQQFDESTVLFFQSIAGNPIFDIFMQSVTEAGDVFYMLAFGAILVIIKKTRKIGVVLMILLVLTTLLTGYIKCGIDRERPNLTFFGTHFIIEATQDTFALFCEGGANASFPSGHASRATVFGMVLGFALSQKFPRGCYLLLLYPILMSISRIYVLQHFPMDVIGGTILGILLTGVVAKKAKLGKIFELKT